MSVDKLKQTVLGLVAVSLFLVSGAVLAEFPLNLTEGVTPTSHKSLRITYDHSVYRYGDWYCCFQCHGLVYLSITENQRAQLPHNFITAPLLKSLDDYSYIDFGRHGDSCH